MKNILLSGGGCRLTRWLIETSILMAAMIAVMAMTKVRRRFICPIHERTEKVFRKITTGDVSARLEKAALLKALRIERDRPMRSQTAR